MDAENELPALPRETAAPAARPEAREPVGYLSPDGEFFRSWRCDEIFKAHATALYDAPVRMAITPGGQSEAHADDMAVDRFAAAMKAKLAAARAKGRSGWNDPEACTVDHLSDLLRGHVAKGDPVDVANFAMMLHQRGSGITQPEAAVPAGWVYEGTAPHTAGKVMLKKDRCTNLETRWWVERGPVYYAAPTAPAVAVPLASEYLGRSAGRDVWWPPLSVPPMLTPEQIKEACDGIYLSDFDLHAPEAYDEAIARAIEAAVREQLGVKS